MKRNFAFLCLLAAKVTTLSATVSADTCDSYDVYTEGPYNVYNNLYAKDAATSGSQCLGVDGLSGSTISWHTTWTWSGGSGQVKSYSNVELEEYTRMSLGATSTILTTWMWSYSGTDLAANVAYDLFTSSSASGSTEYEVMVWLAVLGGVSPLTSTGSSIATVSFSGHTFKLYKGFNGDVTVFSFVAESKIHNFSGDLIVFLNYLISKHGLPSSQVITTLGAGTEPFTGSDAVFTTTAYSVSLE